jgi:hypothetical protein
VGRVGDKGVAPPKRDFDQPGRRRPRGLCQVRSPVREKDPADVVSCVRVRKREREWLRELERESGESESEKEREREWLRE